MPIPMSGYFVGMQMSDYNQDDPADVRRKDDEAIVELTGRIIYENLEEMYRKLENMTTSGLDDLYLNMDKLTYLDSSALGMLLSVNNSARAQGTRLTVLSPPTNIRAIFSSTRLDHVLTIAAGDEAKAITSRFD